MAATLCAKLLLRQGWLPLTLTVRHGSKAVTRRRKPMHFLKQKLMAITQYIPPNPGPPTGSLPPPPKRALEDTGLVLVLKKELNTIFQECKMIAVIQNNATNAEDMQLLKQRLHKHDITIKFFPNKVMQSFLTGGPYRQLMPLFIGPTVLFVSKEPKVKEMLGSLRSSPQMVMLGACIENRLLSHQGVVSYSKLPSVTVVQGELVSGLTLLTSQTASMLQRHPAHLSALLHQYVQQQGSEGGSGESAPQAEETA